MFRIRLTLQGDFFSRRMAVHKSKTRQRKFVGASAENVIHGQLSKMENRLPGTNGAMSPPLKPV